MGNWLGVFVSVGVEVTLEVVVMLRLEVAEAVAVMGAKDGVEAGVLEIELLELTLREKEMEGEEEALGQLVREGVVEGVRVPLALDVSVLLVHMLELPEEAAHWVPPC